MENVGEDTCASLSVVLVARPGRQRERLLLALEANGARVEVTVSPSHLAARLRDRDCHGVFIDARTEAHVSVEDAQLFRELSTLFPAASLDVGATGQIVARPVGGGRNAKDGLSLTSLGPQARMSVTEFLSTYCEPFVGRRLRTAERASRNLRVVISPTADFRASHRAVTKDVSVEGCFVMTSAGEFQGLAEVYLRFPDLRDETPIRAEVCWSLEWDAPGGVPGLGLRFTRLRPRQLERLFELLGVGVGSARGTFGASASMALNIRESGIYDV